MERALFEESFRKCYKKIVFLSNEFSNIINFLPTVFYLIVLLFLDRVYL